MKKLIALILVLAFLSFISCGKGSIGKNTPVVETIDGVEYVHNQDIPIHPDRTVEFEEELTITGEDEETGDIYLYQLYFFTVDEYNNVYAADPRECKIAVFDKDGKCIRTFGKKGQGPGEFQSIRNIEIMPDGNLFVIDSRNRRCSIINSEGKFQESFNFSLKGASFNDIFFFVDKTFTGRVSTFGGEKGGKLFVKTFDFNGKEIQNYGEFRVPHRESVTEYDEHGSSGTYAMSPPYAPKSIFASDRDRNLIYHCINSEYLIEVFDFNGKIISKIDRPYDSLPFTGEDEKEFFDNFRNRPGQDPKFEKVLKKLKMPDVKTIAEFMCVDDKGNLWIKTQEEKEVGGKKLTAYDIFNSDGFYETKIWSDIPDLYYYPALFKNSKFYRLEMNRDEGTTSIIRYNVTWTEKSR